MDPERLRKTCSIEATLDNDGVWHVGVSMGLEHVVVFSDHESGRSATQSASHIAQAVMNYLEHWFKTPWALQLIEPPLE